MSGYYAVLAAGALAGCSFMPCKDRVLKEVISPDGRWTATAYERDCGATTGFSRNVLLRPAKKRFAGGSPVFVGNKFDRVGIKWDSASVLTIIYPDYARTFTAETNFGEITIRYEQVRRQSDVP